jgi:hypothetical protein
MSNQIKQQLSLSNQNSAGNPQKAISSKHQQIQHIRQINSSTNDHNTSQGLTKNSDDSNASPGQSKYFPKNQLRHISKLVDGEDDVDMSDDDDEHLKRPIKQERAGGMTLEDDVESILSD